MREKCKPESRPRNLPRRKLILYRSGSLKLEQTRNAWLRHITEQFRVRSVNSRGCGKKEAQVTEGTILRNGEEACEEGREKWTRLNQIQD